jgi:hypothetical protein
LVVAEKTIARRHLPDDRMLRPTGGAMTGDWKLIAIVFALAAILWSVVLAGGCG